MNLDDRTQEVDICLKFIGKFDVPPPEQTTEELAKMEKQRKQRAYYRELSKRQRQRGQQKKLSEQENLHKIPQGLCHTAGLLSLYEYDTLPAR